MIVNVPLSKLVSGKTNPRRVKPEKDAHRRLVASIRAFGLLEPLVVRPADGNSNRYQVIAGFRRLAALNEVHRGSKQDPKIPCEVRKVDDSVAASVSLAENFVRENMHPLDEAETFARLAGDEGKQAEDIAAQFGVSPNYVRQRMKLATLAEPIKAAYREDKIDTAIAEAFTAVPPERQIEIWKECRGAPHHAQHVRNIIENGWIDASHALFDVTTLPPSAVSRDLFSERILVERSAFLEAQNKTLAAKKQQLVEEGWKEAVVGRREDVQDRLYAMSAPERRYDQETTGKLAGINSERKKLEAKQDKVKDGDEAALKALWERSRVLDDQEREIVEKAESSFSEATKAVGTAFLILDPDGQVRREYRVPRQQPSGRKNGAGGSDSGQDKTKPPTSDDLTDSQLAETFTHQALAVREALLDNAAARKRILVMILHDKIRSEAMSIRHEANGVTLHATQAKAFSSTALDRLRKCRAELDLFKDEKHLDDCGAYAQLIELSKSKAKLDALIDLLVVECVTAHPLRPTELVRQLALELQVDLRRYWRPNAEWLAGFQKIQLAHLLAQFRGKSYSPAHETRKKTELVQVLAKLFADAAEGKLEDKKLAEKMNRWLPANLRGLSQTDDK